MNEIRTLTVDLSYTEFHLLKQALRDKQFQILDCLQEMDGSAPDELAVEFLNLRLGVYQSIFSKVHQSAPDYLNAEV